MNVCFLNFDVFTSILVYLDYQDIKNFLLLNKGVYNYYKFNRVYVSLLVTKSIEKTFGIYDCHQCLLDDQGIIKTTVLYNRIYNQFRLRKNVNLADIIIYLVENKYDYGICILQKIIPMCVLKVDFDYVGQENVITYGDMSYLIVYTDEVEIDILLAYFVIPISVIAYSIQEMTLNRLKVYKIIDYVYYKYCFGKLDCITDTYMHMILVHFIKQREDNLVKYFLVKKRYYRIRLIYQTLINECLLNESMECLRLLINEFKDDNEVSRIHIIIDKSTIEKLSKRGSFHVIKYIIDNLLGNVVNMSMYIKSICSGIEHCNSKSFTMYFRKLQVLEGYFDERSKNMINSCLRSHVRNVNGYVI